MHGCLNRHDVSTLHSGWRRARDHGCKITHQKLYVVARIWSSPGCNRIFWACTCVVNVDLDYDDSKIMVSFPLVNGDEVQGVRIGLL